MQKLNANYQPLLVGNYEILYEEYQLGDLLVDLYGERTTFGFEIFDVVLRGLEKISLFSIVPDETIKRLEQWLFVLSKSEETA